MSKKTVRHKQTKASRSRIKTEIEQNWDNKMKSTKQKKMSQGAQQIARIIKSRTHWGNKQLWGNPKKEK